MGFRFETTKSPVALASSERLGSRRCRSGGRGIALVLSGRVRRRQAPPQGEDRMKLAHATPRLSVHARIALAFGVLLAGVSVAEATTFTWSAGAADVWSDGAG